MLAKDKRRVSVVLPKTVVEKIDKMANKSGMSRSQMIAFMTVQGVESYEAVLKFPEEKLNRLVQMM